jgi:S1-C subfamily serine protease
MHNRLALIVLTAGWVGVMLGWLTAQWVRQSGPAVAQDIHAVGPVAPLPQETPRLQSSMGELTPEEWVNVRVYELTNRSVVHITTKGVVQDLFFETVREGAGSGSVLDRQGHILTNYHVVEKAQRIRVTLFTGDEYPAELVGYDTLTDIAVLRIDAPPDQLYPITFGNSSQLRVGQRVYAIGNPFGLERTMTTGIISSLNRTLPSRNKRLMRSIIQIDAALNQGNSGGPLLDTQARLIGMNTAIASSTGENTGVGFAIPVNTIARVVPQLIQRGHVIRPDVGIIFMVETPQGPAVVAVSPGGPAERAGLQGFRIVKRQTRRGLFVYEESRIDREHADVVRAVDGKPVKTVDDFVTEIESKEPGQRIVLQVLRDGRLLEVPLILGAAAEP